ncbi:zinc ribbon domain-containing protein [Massilia solisilvae]|uniref:Zinc ribbon domain-containing protein n=1 Tax=Massilia solisilvae TaxID=1811225 RepID=A0ABT2BQC5_9BURK|nr:FmdB family zinc ribbon protein [Massilia solisilvae]MCS0610718.1 zinc ribbon domain-containing protein [Massilia solisilvae]
MPIYAYRCAECGFSKDVLQKISDAPLTTCLSCGKPAFQKQVTAAGFQLKGTGWYVTDFRGGSSSSSGGSSGSSEQSAPAATSTGSN